MTLPQYCQIIVSKAQKNNEPLLSQAIWRDTILKHFACTIGCPGTRCIFFINVTCICNYNYPEVGNLTPTNDT